MGDRLAAKARRNEKLSGLFSTRQKLLAAGLAATATVGAVTGIEHNIDNDNPLRTKTAAEVGEAPRQVTPSQISSHETSPSTTMVTVGEGQGSYQVVAGAVEQGIVSPEDAAQIQADVQAQYDAAPDKTMHPNQQVSVQVSQ